MAEQGETKAASGGCARYIILFFVLLAAAVVLLGLNLKRVEPWEVGLRYWNLSLPGLVKKGDVAILNPGYNIIIPYLHQFNRYDSRLQRMEMARSYEDVSSPHLPPLKVRTAKDQDEIDVDVTILYHVKKQMATELRKHYSDNTDILEQGIKIRCPQILQAGLGQIETAFEFYSRSKKVLVEEAKKEMNREFGPRGVQIFEVLIRDFKFRDNIEASIISKVIADERVEMEEALKRTAEAKAEWQSLVAEANAAAEAERARGTAEVRRIDARADKYMTEKKAMGDKLIMEAEAEGKGRINQALAVQGAKTYVGLEYARALQGIELIVIPTGGPEGINPLDLKSTVEKIRP